MTLPELVRRVRGEQAFDAIEQAYLHRAVREQGGAVIRGRDAIRDLSLAAAARGNTGAVTITADLGDMIAWRDQGGAGHHWVWRSGGRILRETIVYDGMEGAMPSAPLHAPLGELRSGRGQLQTTDMPDLPPGWPAAARHHARRLHRIWNARALGQVGDHDWQGPNGRSGEAQQQRAWIMEVLAALPDATLMFERAIVGDQAVALLWRLHGHHLGQGFGFEATGRRVRMIGSTLMTLAGGEVSCEQTLIGEGAVMRQLAQPIVDYAAV